MTTITYDDPSIIIPDDAPAIDLDAMREEARGPPECACYICTYGFDAWLFNFHPSEY